MVESVAMTELLDHPHSLHQREFCTEGSLGEHALCMRENTAMYTHTHWAQFWSILKGIYINLVWNVQSSFNVVNLLACFTTCTTSLFVLFIIPTCTYTRL